MPTPHPAEFGSAVELARSGQRPIRDVPRSLGISASCLRNWSRAATVESGARKGLTSAERKD